MNSVGAHIVRPSMDNAPYSGYPVGADDPYPFCRFATFPPDRGNRPQRPAPHLTRGVETPPSTQDAEDNWQPARWSPTPLRGILDPDPAEKGAVWVKKNALIP